MRWRNFFASSLLSWFWVVALAPPLIAFVLWAAGLADPAAAVPMPLHSTFRMVWRVSLLVAALTLSLGIVCFRRIAACFGDGQQQRWPFYSAFLALCASAVLAIGFAIAMAYPD